MANEQGSPRDLNMVSEEVEDEREPRFSWPHMYLGAIGFAISIYAFRLHGVIKAGGDSGCGISDTINCDKVLASQYGAFLGLPLGVWGMAYFVLVVLVSVTTNPKVSLQQETLWRLLVCGAGFVGTLALSYISYVILKAACPVCMSIHAVIIACFGLALWQFFNVRGKNSIVSSH